MKFDKLKKFKTDFDALPVEHRRAFRSAMPLFNAACEAYAANPATLWPANLRVKRMAGHKGIWEMTWSFAQPDGRATFEFIRIDNELAVRWRRIGRHDIFREP